MEILQAFGVIKQFATNIKVTNSPFPIERITNMEDLDLWLKSNPHKKHFTLDEAGKAMRRRTPMSGLNIDILDMVQVIRHYGAHLTYIAPNEKFIDSAMLGTDVLDIRIIKPDYKNKKLGVWFDLMEQKRIDFTNIPPTSIRYDSFDIAPFTKRSPNKIRFKDEERQWLWDWTHGTPAQDLPINEMRLSRLRMRFIREVLEREANAQPS